MEKYFTNGYKIVKEIRGAQISLDSHGRWICYCNVEKAGANHEEITLYDNYCERYTIKYDVSNKTFVDLNGQGYFSHDIITLKSKTINQHPLPDFCIDVIQTFSCAIAFETVRRQAEIIAKNYMSRTMENKPAITMYYPHDL
jgi:hypothetical protein